MNNYFWLVLVPNLNGFFSLLGISGIVACIICGFFYMTKKNDAYDDEDREIAKKTGVAALKMFSVSMVIFFITCFIPSKKDLITLKILSVVSELKGADKIPQKLIDRLNALLDGDKND